MIFLWQDVKIVVVGVETNVGHVVVIAEDHVLIVQDLVAPIAAVGVANSVHHLVETIVAQGVQTHVLVRVRITALERATTYVMVHAQMDASKPAIMDVRDLLKVSQLAQDRHVIHVTQHAQLVVMVQLPLRVKHVVLNARVGVQILAVVHHLVHLRTYAEVVQELA